MSRKLRIAGVVLITAVLTVTVASLELQNLLGWLLGGVASLCVRLLVVFVRILTLH